MPYRLTPHSLLPTPPRMRRLSLLSSLFARHLPLVTRHCFHVRSLTVAARILPPDSWLLTSVFLLLTCHSPLVTVVSAQGIITTVAGNGRALRGEGGPATSALLDRPNGVEVDGSGNVYIADTNNDRVRKVLATPPSFSVTPATLNFTAAAGVQIVARQQIAVSSSLTGLAWSARATTESSGNWLTVSPTEGFAPSTISVTVNVAELAPGTYRGTVTVRAALASPPSFSVAVELTVTAALPPQLSVKPSSITLESSAGRATRRPKGCELTTAVAERWNGRPKLPR